MELDVCLARRGDEPWGFRLLGGTDFGMPLTVVKVYPNSPAEHAGLRNGDVVSWINSEDAGSLSHDQSKAVVGSAGDQLVLKVVRGLYELVLEDTEPLYDSTDQLTDQSLDFDQPSLPTEVDYVDLSIPRYIEQPGPLPVDKLLECDETLLPPLDKDLFDPRELSRSLTASPFAPQLKPYRPFSTEPVQEIPALEDPIILNPDYHDEFGRLKEEEEFLPVTKFKLPISEQYDPDGSKMRMKLMKKEVREEGKVTVCEGKAVKIEETGLKISEKAMKYEEKEMKEQIMTKEEDTFLEEIKKEIDIDKIEMTATSIVDESIEKAVSVAEEIKNEMAVELKEISSESVKESSETVSKEELALTEEKYAKKAATKEVFEQVEILDKTTEEIMKQDGHKVEERYEAASAEATVEQREASAAKSKVSVEEIDEKVSDTKAEAVVDTLATSVEEYSVTDQRKAQISESKAKVSEKSSESIDEYESEIQQSNVKAKVSERSTEKTAAESVTTATDKRYSTSKLLAEQRAYVIGLQTIPNIRGTVHSSYHYDLLLKTFFIHLTDVMVALSRFILAEPVLQAKPGQTVDTQVRRDVTEQVKETVSVEKQKVKKEKANQEVQKQDVKVQKEEKKDVKELAKVFTADTQEVKQKEVGKIVAKQEEKVDATVKKEKVVQAQTKIEEKAMMKVKEEAQQRRQYEEYNHVNMTDSFTEDVSKRTVVSGSKMAQRTEKKSEELMQKMEAVITEFESKSGGEDIESVRERRSKSCSRPESRADEGFEEFGEERLTLSEEKSSQVLNEVSSKTGSLESTTRRSRYETEYDAITSTGDNNTYVAIVEAHVYTNKDAIFEENLKKADTTTVKETVERKAVDVEKSVVEAKKSSELVKEKKDIVQEMKANVIQKIVEDKKEVKDVAKKEILKEVAKKEEVKEVVKKTITKDEAKQVSHEISIQDKIENNKEDQIEVATVVAKKEEKQKTQEVLVAKRDDKKEIVKVVAKQEEKQKVAEVIETKEVIKENAKEVAVADKKMEKREIIIQEEKQKVAEVIKTKEVIKEKAKEVAVADKKIEKREIIIQEIVEPVIETQELILDQDYSVTEAKEEISSAASEQAVATEIVTAQLVAAAEKLSLKTEELQESAVKEVAKETTEFKDKIVTEKFKDKRVEVSKETKQETVTQKEEKVAIKEDISTTQTVVAASTAIRKEEKKEATVKTEEVKAIKKEKKEVAAIIKEDKSEVERTFTFKKPVEEKIEAVAIQEESTQVKVSKEKVERKTRELDVEKSSVFKNHTECSAIKTQHMQKESTFVAKTDMRDLKLTLKTDLSKQESVISEENGIETPTSSTVPPTPLTDEYMFKLEIPLPKLTGPPPIRDCTPSDDEEDTEVAKKGLVPVIEAQIEDQTIFNPPLPTPPVSPSSPRSPRSPTYIKPGLKGGVLGAGLFKPVASAFGNGKAFEDHAEKKGLGLITEAKTDNTRKSSNVHHEDPNIVKKSVAVQNITNPQKYHEDPNIVKKPDAKTLLFTHSSTKSASNVLKEDEDPHVVKKKSETNEQGNQQDQTPTKSPFAATPVSNSTPRPPKFPVYMKPGLRGGAPIFSGFPGSTKRPKFPTYTKPGLNGGADRDYTKEEILEIERKSSLLASAIDETIKSIEEYKEEVGMNKKTSEAHKTNGVMYNGYAKVVETKIFDKSIEEKSATEKSVTIEQHQENKTTDFVEETEFTKDITETTLVDNGIESFDTRTETKFDSVGIKTDNNDIKIEITNNVDIDPTPEEIKKQDPETETVHNQTETEAINIETNNNVGAEPTFMVLAPEAIKEQRAEIDTINIQPENNAIQIGTNNDVETEPTSVVAPEVIIKKEVKDEVIRDPLEGYRSVHFDPEELLNAQRERRALGVRIPQLTASQDRELYKTEGGEILGTKKGIVDGLDKAVVDPDVAKELGKPGITEEKIAELISGEAEMLREAHVMGLKRVLTSHMTRDDDSSVDFKKIKPTIETLKDSEVLKALNEEMMKAYEEKKKQEEKKWTTFLQKPKRPVPKNKFGYTTPEEEVAEPYKVKIVKQPKPKVAPDYKPKDFNTGLLPWEERALREPTPPPVDPEDPILIPEEAPELLEAVDPLPESEVPDLEDSGIPLPPPEPEAPPTPPEEPKEPEEPIEEPQEELDLEAVVAETEQIVEQDLADMERNNIAEQLLMSVQNMVDPNASLDQQVAQMRAQLAALAQLPGVIQQSLELVTKQLSQLSQLEVKQSAQEEVEEMTPAAVEEAEATETSVKVEEVAPEQQEAVAPAQSPAQPEPATPAEQSLRPEELELMRREEEAMLEEQRRVEKQKKEALERARLTQETLAQEVSFPQVGMELKFGTSMSASQDSYAEEAMERARLEHESRQVKARACPRVGKPKPVFGPATPQERPLVLPGGRRWRKPQDAYNEQLFTETLQAQAEIIAGKAKGINFMKYEKPPVSLEHLKHSDVYKLIHSQDQTPLKRTDLLTPVMAEEDYREKCRSMTPCPERLAQQVQP